MKILKRLLATLLAVCLLVTGTLVASAKEDELYLADLRIVYAETYEEALSILQNTEFKEYSLLNYNLNATAVKVDLGFVTFGEGNGVFLAYKTTTDVDEAITDVAVMQMDGGYRIGNYQEMVAKSRKDYEAFGNTLTYVVDLMAGALVVYVKINGQIRYQFPGKMGYNIPLTGQNYTAMGSGFVTAMAGLAATIATGGTAAPFTAGATAAGIVNAMKPEVYRGGNLSGDASMLSLKTPFLIRSSPNKPAIDDQAAFTGAPSYKIDTLSNFSGFTQVVEAHIEDISCTSAERDEIMQLLKSGVII